jgi:hypothetical protein
MSLLSGNNTPRFAQFPTDNTVGDGSTVTFTLSRSIVSPSTIIVTIDGVHQHANTYSSSGSQIIFSEAPYMGAQIQVLHLGVQGTVQSVSDGAITAAKMDSNNDVGGSQYLIRLNRQIITSNQTIPSGVNGISGGPITIANGVIVVIQDGAEWSIV